MAPVFLIFGGKMKNYILFTLILICFCMTGCSASEVSKADNFNQFTKEETDISSLAERPVMIQLGGNKSQVIYEVIDVNNEDRQGKLYSYNLESKQLDALSLERSIELEDVYLQGCMNEAGELFLIRENGFYIYRKMASWIP